MGYYIPRKQLFLGANFEPIPDVFSLERIGAGHDGFVYRDGDVAYKVLKHGIDGRKEKGLMAFDKAMYLQQLDLKRFINPEDFLIDYDGVYAGYVMPYYEDLSKPDEDGIIRKNIGEFTCGELVQATEELSEDVSVLTRKGIAIKDINRGSYIFDSDFLHICDMDKYILSRGKALQVNWSQLNFMVAKMMYFEKMEREGYFRDKEFANEINRKMNEWIRKSSNSTTFIKNLIRDLQNEEATPISDYTDYTFQKVLL